MCCLLSITLVRVRNTSANEWLDELLVDVNEKLYLRVFLLY